MCCVTVSQTLKQNLPFYWSALYLKNCVKSEGIVLIFCCCRSGSIVLVVTFSPGMSMWVMISRQSFLHALWMSKSRGCAHQRRNLLGDSCSGNRGTSWRWLSTNNTKVNSMLKYIFTSNNYTENSGEFSVLQHDN